MTVPVTAAVLGRVAAMDTMAATGRDAAQLLEVHVDQLARLGTLIAADHSPVGRSIQASRLR